MAAGIAAAARDCRGQATHAGPRVRAAVRAPLVKQVVRPPPPGAVKVGGRKRDMAPALGSWMTASAREARMKARKESRKAGGLDPGNSGNGRTQARSASVRKPRTTALDHSVVRRCSGLPASRRLISCRANRWLSRRTCRSMRVLMMSVCSALTISTMAAPRKSRAGG